MYKINTLYSRYIDNFRNIMQVNNHFKHKVEDRGHSLTGDIEQSPNAIQYYPVKYLLFQKFPLGRPSHVMTYWQFQATINLYFGICIPTRCQYIASVPLSLQYVTLTVVMKNTFIFVHTYITEYIYKDGLKR